MSTFYGYALIIAIVLLEYCILFIDEIKFLRWYIRHHFYDFLKKNCFYIKKISCYISIYLIGSILITIFCYENCCEKINSILISILTIIVTLIINNVIISTRNKYIEIKSKLLSCKQKADLLKKKIDDYKSDLAKRQAQTLVSTQAGIDYFFDRLWEDKRTGIIENYKEMINNIKSISFELVAIYEVHPKSSHLNKEEINKIKEDLLKCDINVFAFKDLEDKDTWDKIIKVLNDTIDKIKI